MIMNSKVYDALKIVSIVIGALGTLYFAISQMWGLPYGAAIEGTAIALVTFLDTFLKRSSDVYKTAQNVELGKKYCTGFNEGFQCLKNEIDKDEEGSEAE